MRDQSVFGKIAHYLQTEFFPCSDLFSQRVLLTLYRLVAKGDPVTLEGLSAAIGADRDLVMEVVGAVPPSRRQYDEAGRIIAFAGLSQVPANHRFMFGDLELFTWCAFDALFLPELLDGTAGISSICPVTGSIIRVTASRYGLEAVEPDGAVMSFVMPDQGSCCADLRGAFCNHVNFFASRQAGEIWLRNNTKAVMLSLDDAFALGRISNQSRFGHALADELRAQTSRGGTT
jgi:alkylmercury lyase